MQLRTLNLDVAAVQGSMRRVCTLKYWRTSTCAPLFSVMRAMYASSAKRFLAPLLTGDVPVDL